MIIRQKHYAKACVPNILIIVRIFSLFQVYALGMFTVYIYAFGNKS